MIFNFPKQHLSHTLGAGEKMVYGFPRLKIFKEMKCFVCVFFK